MRNSRVAYKCLRNVGFWLRGRARLTLLGVLILAPVALFFGWGIILQLSADVPPGRGLELIPLLSYSLLALASHSPVQWIERQSPRRLFFYHVSAFVGRSLFVVLMLAGLGFAFGILPADKIPFGETFGLDDQTIPVSYFIRISIGVLIIGYAAEFFSLLTVTGSIPVLTLAFYIGVLYVHTIFGVVFPMAIETGPVLQVALCLMMVCAVTVARLLRVRGRIRWMER